MDFAILEWVDWFNNRRLLAPNGVIPAAEAEMPPLCIIGSASHGSATSAKQPPAKTRILSIVKKYFVFLSNSTKLPNIP
jgi:hypothetical protein